MTCSHCTHPMYAGIRCGDCGRWTDEKEEEMSKDDILRMAMDAGIMPWTKHEWLKDKKSFVHSDEGLDGDLACLMQFAALVAAAEREACAKVCEDEAEKWEGDDGPISTEARLCAINIRARGEK